MYRYVDLLHYNQESLLHVSAIYCGHFREVFFEGILHTRLKQFINIKCLGNMFKIYVRI